MEHIIIISIINNIVILSLYIVDFIITYEITSAVIGKLRAMGII